MTQIPGNRPLDIVIRKHVHARIQAEFTNKLPDIHFLDRNHDPGIFHCDISAQHSRPPDMIDPPLLHHSKPIRRAQSGKPFKKTHPLQMERHADIAHIIRQNRSSISPRKRPRHLRHRNIGKIKRHRPRRRSRRLDRRTCNRAIKSKRRQNRQQECYEECSPDP